MKVHFQNIETHVLSLFMYGKLDENERIKTVLVTPTVPPCKKIVCCRNI